MNWFIDGFVKTFVKEDRWKLFVEGILTTLFITLSALLLGTFIGYGMYLLSRKNVVVMKIFNAIGLFFHRTPVVVLLMILYFLQFFIL